MKTEACQSLDRYPFYNNKSSTEQKTGQEDTRSRQDKQQDTVVRMNGLDLLLHKTYQTQHDTKTLQGSDVMIELCTAT